jgi:hypothetical protein
MDLLLSPLLMGVSFCCFNGVQGWYWSLLRLDEGWDGEPLLGEEGGVSIFTAVVLSSIDMLTVRQ